MRKGKKNHLKSSSEMVQRLIALQQFRFRAVHIPRKYNPDADAMSRVITNIWIFFDTRVKSMCSLDPCLEFRYLLLRSLFYTYVIFLLITDL